MEILLIVALLASNVWLIRKVLTKPDTPPAAENGRTITGNTPVQPEAKTPEDENSIIGKSNFDIGEFKDIVKEATKEAAKEVIPLIVKEMGTSEDAGFPEPPVKAPSAQIPDDRLDDAFSNMTLSELTGEMPEPAPPRTDGNDFNAINTTIRVLKGEPHTPEDEQTARRVLPDLQGTEIIEKIKLDPVVRKKILLIECQMPDMPDDPVEQSEEEQPDTEKRRRIVFQTHIDTTDIDAVDFNMYH